jgi:type II secretion system protein J
MKLKEAFSIFDFRFAMGKKKRSLRFDSIANRQSPIANARAFTLIEIMLAVGIFAILIAALYSTWMLVVRATIVGKETAAQLQRERVAMHSIEDALTCIQSHQASIEYYTFIIQNGDQPELSFTAYLPDTYPRSGEFVVSDPDDPLNSKMDFHLRRLTFSLEPGQGSEKDLVLRQNPILMDLSDAEQNTPLILAHNVTDFLIECWDTNTLTWDTEWDATNDIPPFVRVTLGFGSQNSGGAQVITREVSFPSGTMPTAVQTPNGNGGGGGGNGNNNRGNNNNGGNGRNNRNNGGQNNPNYPNNPNRSPNFPNFNHPFGRQQ